MKLFLCRHGETDSNVQKRLQGRLETSINGHGLEQAELIAQKLKKEEFDFVFSSPQKRCVETARAIMKYHENRVVYRDELKEVDLGKYTGMDRHDIEKKFPGDWAKRVDSKYDFMHEGGESYKSADKNRIKPMLNEFREKYSSRKLLVVTHGGICRLLLGNLLGLSEKEKMRIDLPNDCIYYIDYLPHKTVVRYYLCESGLSGEGHLTKEKMQKHKNSS